MKTEQKDTLVSHLADMVGRREGDIIDTAVYHFVHHGHCTSNRPKKDIVNLLHSLIDNNESTAETQGHKAQTTVADGESPESTLDELIERITCDILPIRKTRPTESMYEFQRDHNADCSNDYEGTSWEKTAVSFPQNPDAEPPSQARDNRPDSDSDSECSSDSMEMEENKLDSMVSANKPGYQNIDNMTDMGHFMPDVHVTPRVVNLKNSPESFPQ